MNKVQCRGVLKTPKWSILVYMNSLKSLNSNHCPLVKLKKLLTLAFRPEK